MTAIADEVDDADPTAEGTPRLHLQDHVATIELRRPSRRNSLTSDDLKTLRAHFDAIEARTDLRVVVLKARGGVEPPVFCAGYDLGGFDGEAHDPRAFERTVDALERLSPVTVCALHGSVYGGATDLALACDLRVGLQGAQLSMPALRIGLHYYPSGLRRYVSVLGAAMARRAFLSARPIPYEALERLGFFVDLADEAGFEPALESLVRSVASLAPQALRSTKRSLMEVAAGIADERALRSREEESAASSDFAEGRAAVRARRAPQFKGR